LAVCLFLKRIVMLKCRQCIIIPESWPGLYEASQAVILGCCGRSAA